MTVEPLRKILPYTTVLVVLAAIYAGYTMYSRRDDEARMDREKTQREAEASRDSLNRLGGGDLKILQLYASPGTIKRGETGKVCYGVAFAKTVRLDPETEAIAPSLARCVDVKPVRATHYTLTAEDGKGRKVSQSVDVDVR